MEGLSLKELSVAVKAETVSSCSAPVRIKDVSIDTRTLEKGSAFFAIAGQKYDGHDFLSEAANKGASVLVVSRAVKRYPNGVSVLRVGDTLKALQELASDYRKRYDPFIIGVTGSNGKTTTKELIKSILSGRYNIAATRGNYNNHIGLPMTIFSLTAKTDILILEMAANHPGEIKRLSEIASPLGAAVITSIGNAHLEFFKDKKTVLLAKMEILSGLPSGGVVVLNNDDPYLSPISEDIRCVYKVVRYGMGPGASVRALKIKASDSGIEFVVKAGSHSVPFFLSSIGRFNVYNVLAAVSIGLDRGLSLEEMASSLRDFRVPDMHMQISTCRGIKFIDDSYNSNPDSARAAISALAEMHGSRRIAVIGDMLELGERAPDMHRELGEYAASNSIDLVFALGRYAPSLISGALNSGLKGRAFAFDEKTGLIEKLVNILKKGDIVLVKGSRLMRMEDIIKKIKEGV